MLRVIRAFKEVEHVELSSVFGDARGDVMIFVQNQIGVSGTVPVRRELTTIDGTLGVGKHRSTYGTVV
jgi:hypothetical protein